MFNKRNLSSLKNRKKEEDDGPDQQGMSPNKQTRPPLPKVLTNRRGRRRIRRRDQVLQEEDHRKDIRDGRNHTPTPPRAASRGPQRTRASRWSRTPWTCRLEPSSSAQSTEGRVNRATSTYEIDTDRSMDNRSILERNLEIGKKILAGELESKVYRGQGAYKPVMNVREDSIAAAKYTGLYGPVRASATNVRTTLRIDYQPDICKDYKETGYCGFGDTCKFLHDRSDYKSGWQLEKEWEQQQAEKRLKMQRKLDRWHKRVQSNSKGEADEEDEEEEEDSDEDSDYSDDDSEGEQEEQEEGVEPSVKRLLKLRARKLKVPFCCLSCRKTWRREMNPVVTSCGHYFCERCIIEAYSSDMKCPKCQLAQDGIMNRAGAVERLLESLPDQR